MCIKFNFISICTYLCGVCPMYCSCSNYFGPNKFGNHSVLECVLGTLEMHWKLVSYTRKLVSPCAYWSQAWMIVNSYLLHHQCYVGNKYLPHAYFTSFQPCVGCFLAWIFIAFDVFLQSLYQNIFITNVSKLGWLHIKWIYIIILLILQSQIC